MADQCYSASAWRAAHASHLLTVFAAVERAREVYGCTDETVLDAAFCWANGSLANDTDSLERLEESGQVSALARALLGSRDVG